MDGMRGDTVEAPVVIRVARTMDDLQRISVVRALVYMAEQDCPYDEEFDGNDLAGATHLIGEVAGEPLGCLRIRWFADFAKIERVCVRSGHRSGRVARQMMKEAIELIRRKGYRKFVGHVQEHLIPYWKRYGFIHRAHRGVFVFSDRAYAEMEGRPEPHAKALHIDSDPLILDRPEGDWDRPGPLDRSVVRGASPLQGREPDRRTTPPTRASRNTETAS